MGDYMTNICLDAKTLILRFTSSKSMNCKLKKKHTHTMHKLEKSKVKILQKQATYHTTRVVHAIQIYLCHKSNVWG